jgi:hypothetical protein
MICPFCHGENAPAALVCVSCARDIAVPKSLAAERDELVRKRDVLRQALATAKSELEQLKRGKKHRSG